MASGPKPDAQPLRCGGCCQAGHETPGRTKTMRDQDQRPLFDPSPGWVSQDRHAVMTLAWFAVGVALGIIVGWGVAR